MKFINKILATVIFGGFLLSCPNLVKGESKEVLKEKDRYERLFYRDLFDHKTGEVETILGWDRNHNGISDVIAAYNILPIKDWKLLCLKLIAEDKNTNYIFEENEYTNKNEEYNKFLLKKIKKRIILAKCGNDDKPNRLYYYELISSNIFGEECYKLDAIQDPTNFLWKSKSFNEADTNQDGIDEKEGPKKIPLLYKQNKL